MKLYITPGSPYARMARIVVLEKGLESRVETLAAGLSRVKWDALRSELLWVHHADDPCSFTSYRDAQEFARRSGKPLVTVRGGGPGRGDACQAFTAHGFVGVERETLKAMQSWIRTGRAPAQVAP